MYPLPATDIINIDLQLTANTQLKYFITDNNGNIIREKNWMRFTNGKHTMTIPTDFPKGIYYLSVVSPNDYIHTKKILKE